MINNMFDELVKEVSNINIEQGEKNDNFETILPLTNTKIFDEAISSVQQGNSQCAFILNPTRVSEIREVASNGEKMPQKSTYFYPKMITGLVMNQLEN